MSTENPYSPPEEKSGSRKRNPVGSSALGAAARSTLIYLAISICFLLSEESFYTATKIWKSYALICAPGFIAVPVIAFASFRVFPSNSQNANSYYLGIAAFVTLCIRIGAQLFDPFEIAALRFLASALLAFLLATLLYGKCTGGPIRTSSGILSVCTVIGPFFFLLMMRYR